MDIERINPELREAFRKSPNLRFDGRWVLWLGRRLTSRTRDLEPPQGVTTEDRNLGDYSIRIYSPEGGKSGAAILWIHGGGLVLGTVAMNWWPSMKYQTKLCGC